MVAARMPQTLPLSSIVILGGGTAGWMTAAALSLHFSEHPVTITLVESSEIGIIGVGEATIPTIRSFYKSLGMRDVDVIAATKATCKLGIQFEGWSRHGQSFFHPFGLFGLDVGDIGFHDLYAKHKDALGLKPYDHYSLATMMARAGKFTTPVSAPEGGYDTTDWALHFDAGLFAEHLSKFSREKGVAHIDAEVADVALDSFTGDIEALILKDGQRVSGDIFIDCSGFGARLIGKALGVGFESYRQWLFCDRAIAIPSEALPTPNAFTRVRAERAGWQWTIPLQHRCGNGHVYSSDYMADDEAQQTVLSGLPSKAIGTPRVIKFEPGRRIVSWEKNCISVGLASGFLEPLESTSIALIQTAIERIKQLLPAKKKIDPAIRDEFNDMARREFERVRDFIILHYKLNMRHGEAFWDAARAMIVPDSLAHKMALYKAKGHFVRYRWEMFHPASFMAIYAGFDVWPQDGHPALWEQNPKVVASLFSHVESRIAAYVQKAPPHHQFVSHCVKLAETAHEHS